MLSNPHFYNRTLRKVVVAFGTMFNDIDLIRFTKDGTPKEKIKVPLSYGPKEKYLTRITSDPNLTKSVMTVVPRMSFNLEGLSYDADRKQVSTIKNFASNSGVLSTQYVPVPYNFDFSLSIFVRNIEDGTQILEQILPFFTPDFTVTVDFIEPMAQKYDMPVILTSVSSSMDFEGDMTTTRLVMWDLEFTAKGYIWPPVKTNISSQNGYIRRANTNIYQNPTMNANTQVVNIFTRPDPVDADIDDTYGYTEIITEYFDGTP